jgi:hypothetical protein
MRKTFERYHIVSDRDVREVAVKMSSLLALDGHTSGHGSL